MNSIEFEITIEEGTARDILIAELTDAGCTGFEELETTLKAYSSEETTVLTALIDVIEKQGYSFRQNTIAPKNWNALWEASFEPVIVPGFCTVRAPFHKPSETPFEIVILPKMAFGTGHHATTRLMMQAMKDIPSFAEVLDFGTGTGILAILAHQLGAKSVLGIDIDEWSIRNAVENAASNQAPDIKIQQGDIFSLSPALCFDVVLANINRNTLLEAMTELRKRTRNGGTLLLSGFLKSDVPQLVLAASENNFALCESFNEGDWMCLKFTA